MGWFKNNRTDPASGLPGKILVTDFHSHLLPGLDDGVKDYDDAIAVIKYFDALGFSNMITTPHISLDYYNNDPDEINVKLGILRERADSEGLQIKLYAAAEYMVDDGFRKHLDAGRLLTLGNGYLLLELSSFMPHPDFSAILFDLQSAGYRVILAHPERYLYWHGNMGMYQSLCDREVFFQVNMLSLSGLYGKAIRTTAERLIDARLISFVGSDVHHSGQLKYYPDAFRSRGYAGLLSLKTPMNSNLLQY